MSFKFDIEGIAEAIAYLTTQIPAMQNEAALFAVRLAHQPYQPDYVSQLMNLPVKHPEKQLKHAQGPATPLYLHNGIRQRVRHIWEDILVKSAMYADGRGAYALTGASDDDQTPLERFIESGSIHAGIRVRYTKNNAPTGVMPTFAIAQKVLANHFAVVEARKIELFNQKFTELRRAAGERI